MVVVKMSAASKASTPDQETPRSSSGTSPSECDQNQFLKSQLDSMDRNWTELTQMMKNREEFLKSETAELKFNNDCALVEQALANQEVKLQSVQFPSDPSEAEMSLLQHEQLVAEIGDMEPRVRIINPNFCQHAQQVLLTYRPKPNISIFKEKIVFLVFDFELNQDWVERREIKIFVK